MSRNIIQILIAVLAIFSSVSHSYAQEQKNCIGTSWSMAAIGVTYERQVDDNTFAIISLQSEMSETFVGRTDYPGLSASFTWNHIFARKESANGNELRFFAGPGLGVGKSHDYKSESGHYFGLKGRIGVQCLFDRRINISVCLAPIIGMHISSKTEHLVMKVYRNGIIQAVMPEIGITYRF